MVYSFIAQIIIIVIFLIARTFLICREYAYGYDI